MAMIYPTIDVGPSHPSQLFLMYGPPNVLETRQLDSNGSGRGDELSKTCRDVCALLWVL